MVLFASLTSLYKGPCKWTQLRFSRIPKRITFYVVAFAQRWPAGKPGAFSCANIVFKSLLFCAFLVAVPAMMAKSPFHIGAERKNGPPAFLNFLVKDTMIR